jgi:hypothetical protein
MKLPTEVFIPAFTLNVNVNNDEDDDDDDTHDDEDDDDDEDIMEDSENSGNEQPDGLRPDMTATLRWASDRSLGSDKPPVLKLPSSVDVCMVVGRNSSNQTLSSGTTRKLRPVIPAFRGTRAGNLQSSHHSLSQSQPHHQNQQKRHVDAEDHDYDARRACFAKAQSLPDVFKAAGNARWASDGTVGGKLAGTAAITEGSQADYSAGVEPLRTMRPTRPIRRVSGFTLATTANSSFSSSMSSLLSNANKPMRQKSRDQSSNADMGLGSGSNHSSMSMFSRTSCLTANASLPARTVDNHVFVTCTNNADMDDGASMNSRGSMLRNAIVPLRQTSMEKQESMHSLRSIHSGRGGSTAPDRQNSMRSLLLDRQNSMRSLQSLRGSRASIIDARQNSVHSLRDALARQNSMHSMHSLIEDFCDDASCTSSRAEGTSHNSSTSSSCIQRHYGNPSDGGDDDDDEDCEDDDDDDMDEFCFTSGLPVRQEGQQLANNNNRSTTMAIANVTVAALDAATSRTAAVAATVTTTVATTTTMTTAAMMPRKDESSAACLIACGGGGSDAEAIAGPAPPPMQLRATSCGAASSAESATVSMVITTTTTTTSTRRDQTMAAFKTNEHTATYMR